MIAAQDSDTISGGYMSKYCSVAAGLMVTMVAASSAAAQTRVAAPVQKPIVQPTLAPAANSAMPAGAYALALHSQKKNNVALNAPEFDAQTSVSRNGNAISIAASNGPTLSGTVSGNQYHASGPLGTGGTLVLNGTAGAGNASSGTFSVQSGANLVTGTFTLNAVTGPQPRAHKIANYGDPKPGSTDGGGGCDFWCGLKQWFGL